VQYTYIVIVSLKDMVETYSTLSPNPNS